MASNSGQATAQDVEMLDEDEYDDAEEEDGLIDPTKTEEDEEEDDMMSEDGEHESLVVGISGKKKQKRRSKNDVHGRDYKCTFCDKTYLSYPALYTHMKNKHAKGPDG